MSDEKHTLVVPILLITVGCGWLLTVSGFGPGIDWIWSLALAVIGVPTVALGGWNRFTAVTGPFFVIASLLSVARQMDRIAFDVELPILVVALGVLMLAARSSAIPVPMWYVQKPPPHTPPGVADARKPAR